MSEIVIPGSPDGLQALVSQLNNAAADIDSVRDRVASNGLDGNWSGQAAEAFRSSLHQLPGELAHVGGAFTGAAAAIGSFAGTLTQLQEQARWYDERVAGAEQELQIARASHAHAENRLDEARHALSLATDPLSVSSATRLVGDGESLVRQVASELEDIGGNLERLVGGQQAIMGEYEDAVRVCAAALNAVRDSGGSPLHGLRAWFDHGIGDVEHGGAALWRDARRGVRDVEDDAGHFERFAVREFDEHWGDVRNALEYVGDGLMIAGVIAIVAAATVGSGGADVPFLLAAAPFALSAFAAADAGAVYEGDDFVAQTGDASERKKYGRLLPGDAFDLGMAALGVFTGGADLAPDAFDLGSTVTDDVLEKVDEHEINQASGVSPQENEYFDPALLRPAQFLLDVPPAELMV